LERAVIGAAGIATASALTPGTDALADGRRDHGGEGHGSSIHAFGKVAVTTEALTVTLLTELLRRVNLTSNVPAWSVLLARTPPDDATAHDRRQPTHPEMRPARARVAGWSKSD
jgi:hypothetical protein